jgi:transcriptional regulator with GAF, ATPase, and Fis domain
MNLGICHAMQCRYGPALAHFDRARTESEWLGWTQLVDVLHANQAEVECHVGLWTQAADRSETLLGRLGAEAASPTALLAWCTRADSLLALGELERAVKCVETATRLAGKQPMPRLWLTTAAVRRAQETAEAQNETVSALDRVVQSESAAPQEVALAYARLADLALEEGVPERALDLVDQGAERLETGAHDVREGRVELHAVRARVLLSIGQIPDASRALENVVEELGRQCVEMEGAVRQAFLSRALHRRVLEDARRVLGRDLGLGPVTGTAAGHQELGELRDVLQLTRRLARAPGLAAAVQGVLDAVLEHTAVERGLVLTWDGESLVPLGARRAGRVALSPAGVALDSQLLDAMMRFRRAVTEHEVRGGSSRPRDRAPRGFRRLAIPLMVGDQVTGAIYLESDGGDRPLDAHRKLILEAIADQAAIAIQHRLQLDEVERLRRRTQADLTRTQARLVKEEARRDQAERAVEAARRQLRHRYDQIIHDSEPMREVLATVDRIVDRNITVLVTGESGTGKELIARALHDHSGRAKGPFVAINCGAIPSNLIESELFGHVRGAFTGAVKDRRGHFELAHRGTLFLDEIGELAPDVQVRLLRVLETSEVTPVGSSRRIHVDVRIVAATNRDLPKEIAEGSFREDLYYRINAIMVRLPALRERPGDLPLLVSHFAERVAAERGEEVVAFGAKVMARFQRHSWPGNVRELRNVVEYATLFAEQGRVPADVTLPF